MEPSNVEVAAWIGLSITSSTCLILLMKKVKQHVSCQYTMTLSTFHFLTTWMVLEILALCKRIKRFTQVPFFKRLTLAFLVMTSIVSMNFNLAANSIGFYQMSKLCCIPYMIVRNIAIKHQKYTARELASLTVLLIGVATFSVSDVEFNLLGAIYAVIAVVTTAHNQLMTGELQKEYALNGPELQLAMIPEEFVLGVIAATAMENIGIKVPRSEIARNMEDVRRIAAEMPFPLIIRIAEAVRIVLNHGHDLIVKTRESKI